MSGAPIATRDQRSRQAWLDRGALLIAPLLPSQNHTLVGYTCQDCVHRKIFPTVPALLTHCSIAIQKGWHQPRHTAATGPVRISRRDPAYSEQHAGNLFAVVARRVGGVDSLADRIFIAIRSNGAPLQVPAADSEQTHDGADDTHPFHQDLEESPVIIDNAVEDDSMGHDAADDVHPFRQDVEDSPAIIDNAQAVEDDSDNMDQDGTHHVPHSFAEVVQLRPEYDLKQVLSEGISKIELGAPHDEVMAAWSTMNARINALKAHGMHKIVYRPQMRPQQDSDNRDDSSDGRAPASASEIAFLAATKNLTMELKNELLNLVKHPHFAPAAIRWTSAEAMVRWSFKNEFNVEFKERVFEHRESDK